MGTRSQLQFLLNFGAARGSQLLAPVVAANLLTVNDYGIVELAHASATLLAAVITLGVNGVVPFVILQAGARGTLGGIYFHQSAVAMICGVAVAGAMLYGVATAPSALAMLLTGVLALQGLWTYVLRARGAPNTSLYVEASPFTLVACAALAAWLWAPSAGLALIQLTLFLALGAMLAPAVLGWRGVVRQGPLRYAETLQAGVPLMLAGLLTLLASTSGRLGIGLLGGNELTGTYAAIARIAALPIVAHQLAVTAGFRDLFSVRVEQLEPLLIRIILLVSATTFLLLAAIPFIDFVFGPAFEQAAGAHQVATALLLAQTILWSGVAQNDFVASRYALLPRLLPWTAVTFVLSMGAASAALLAQKVSVNSFALWHTGVMAVLFAVQCGVMAHMGVRLARYWLLVSGMFALAAVAGLAWLT